MTTVTQLAEALQTLLTTTAEATARATGFVQRRSKLGGAAFAQALVFAWLANPQATVEARAQAAAVAGVAISPQGLEQRCTAPRGERECSSGASRRPPNGEFRRDVVARVPGTGERSKLR